MSRSDLHFRLRLPADLKARIEAQAVEKLFKLVPDRADEIGELLDLQQQREAAQ